MQESPQLANAPGEAQLTWLINSTEKKKKKRKKERKKRRRRRRRKKEIKH
jgi:rRNA processing protein Gar1